MWSKYKELQVPEEDVEIIRTWLKQQPHLPDFLDDLIIRKFLTRCTSMNQAKEFIDSFFTMRHYAPEIFKNRDPLSSAIKNIHSSIQIVVLPKSTKEGFRINIYRFIDPDPNKYMFEQSLKYVTMVHDHRIAKEPDTNGDIWIFDMEKASLAFLSRLTLSTLRKYLNYNQYAQPIKIFQTHVVNAHPVIDRFVSLVKPLLHPIGQRLMFTHRPNSTTLYDYVSRDVLPKEFGGTCGTMDEVQRDYIKHIESHRDFFLDENKWEIDDTKIPGSHSAPQIDEGTFKSLSFD